MLKKLNLKKYWQLYMLLLPALIYILTFQYGPMYGILMAFKDFKPKLGVWGSEWVGFKYFIHFLNYPGFWRMIRNTLSISLYSMATFPCAIILALLLNELRNPIFKKTVQMVTYAPHFLSMVAMCGLIHMFVGREGVLGRIYESITGTAVNLLTIPEYFSSIYVWSGVWQNVGWGTIIYLAALSNVPPELIEAAKIDGAGRLRIIRHINIPCILPTIVIMFIMNTGSILSVGFEKIFLLQNDLNLSTSEVIATYTYQIGLIGGQFSLSTAVGLFNNLVNIFVLLLANAFSKKVSGIGMW